MLRSVTPMIEVVDSKLVDDIAELEKILKNSDNGAGLAATQIGLNRRFFGLKDTKTKKVEVFINPEIEAVFGEKTYPMIKVEGKKDENFLEGCLSFPDYYGTVKRFLKVLVGWEEIEGGKLVYKEKELDGFEAIVWQHEADHLDGVLFVDHIKKEGGKFYRWIGDVKQVWDVGRVIEGKLS